MNNAARSLFLMPKGEAVCSVHIDTRQRQFWDVRQGLHDICHGNGKKRDVFFPRRSVLRNFAQKTKKARQDLSRQDYIRTEDTIWESLSNWPLSLAVWLWAN